tara:strand:+ start:1282 stop:1515 length:234 start_codon:yes stop_codon:yes gene_type:complete
MTRSNVIECDRFLTIRCKAFSLEGVRSNRVMVGADRMDGNEVIEGQVRVWDSAAGSFTACHSLSAKTIAKIRRTFQP